MDEVVSQLVEVIAGIDPGGILAMALVGSSVQGGLRPDSDLDLLLVTRRSLSRPERRLVVDHLLTVSGSRATITPGRPIELSVVTLADVNPWRYPAVCDFQYGEWLRSEYLAGRLPEPREDSNLPVMITSARQHAVQLRGAAVRELLPSVPERDLHRSIHDGVRDLIDDLVGDERNVLLTLARMIVTLDTGSIVPKDVAAEQVAPTLSAVAGRALTRAGQGYLGIVSDDWTTHDALATAGELVDRISRLRAAGQS